MDFDGKSTRREYWYFVLYYFIIAVIFILIDRYLLNPMLGMTPAESLKGGILQGLFALALLLPSIAIGIRRLHDIAKSGWWMLIVFIPFVGGLILIYLFTRKSQ
jgi:uncharacterized membrane protein YhaH (DUF805 family)